MDVTLNNTNTNTTNNTNNFHFYLITMIHKGNNDDGILEFKVLYPISVNGNNCVGMAVYVSAFVLLLCTCTTMTVSIAL